MNDTYIERLKLLTQKTSSGCWIAKGTLSTTFHGSMISLARIAFIVKGGNIIEFKKRQHVFRICRNSSCYNPDHLFFDELSRFFGFINKTNSCWLWMGAVDGGGYGMFFSSSFGPVKSHRFSFLKFIGEIPDGMYVCHTCDNPPCCNPKHLFLGNNQDNMNDKVFKERQSRLFGNRNGRTVLKELDVLNIKNDYKTGKYSYRMLVKKYKISQTQIARIIKGESWKWLS